MLKKKRLSSWDQLMIPYPFSRGIFLWGPPIWVERASGPEAMERARRNVEVALVTMASEAEAMVHQRD